MCSPHFSLFILCPVVLFKAPEADLTRPSEQGRLFILDPDLCLCCLIHFKMSQLYKCKLREEKPYNCLGKWLIDMTHHALEGHSPCFQRETLHKSNIIQQNLTKDTPRFSTDSPAVCDSDNTPLTGRFQIEWQSLLHCLIGGGLNWPRLRHLQAWNSSNQTVILHTRSIFPSALWPSFCGSISLQDGRGVTAADSSSFLLMLQFECGAVTAGSVDGRARSGV